MSGTPHLHLCHFIRISIAIAIEFNVLNTHHSGIMMNWALVKTTTWYTQYNHATNT